MPDIATHWQVGWGVPGGALTALCVGVAVFILAVLGSRLRVRGARGALLIVLRWLSALAIFALGTQPTFWAERVRSEPGSLAVVIDASRSMGVSTEGGTRLARVQEVVSRWLESERGAQAEWFLLGDDLAPAEPSTLREKLTAKAPATALGRRVSELARREDLGAIVVLSDGADTQNASVPAALETRVHTVLAGDARPLRDDTILRIQPDAVAFLHGRAKVHVTLSSVGLGDRALEVLLKRAGRVVASAEVNVPRGGEASTELEFEPLNIGSEVYSVELAVDPRDDVPENNTRPFVARVTRDRLRVLHVSGRPSWDQRFLRGFLKRDPSIDLVSFFILRSVHDLTMSSPSELALIPFPTDELFRQHLTSFDVVLLQDFDYAPYQMGPYLPLIRDYVAQGGGLAMIGGSLSFDGGGYAHTPLAEALPVRMRANDASGAAIVEGAYVPEPVPNLLHHPLLELYPEPAQTLAAFRNLEPLMGANALLGRKERGVVLLEHPTAKTPDGQRLPVLTVGRFGNGRTLALATDTSWHWSMPTAGRGKDPSIYDRFWDRAVRWLTRDPLLEPASIVLARDTHLPGSRVEVSGLAREENYRPIKHAQVSIAVRDAAGEVRAQTSAQTDEQGKLQASLLAPEEPGAYQVLLRHGETELARAPMVVELSGIELSDPKPRAEFLEQLARGTGGRFVSQITRAPDLAEFDTTRAISLGTERHAPFGKPLWAALLFALIALEWVLRRRWGER